MAYSPPPSVALPRWVIVLGSSVIAVHLFALGVLVLAAQSGPWQTDFGPSPARAPEFARSLNRMSLSVGGRDVALIPGYFKLLNMPHDYHYFTDNPEAQAVFIEARLKSASGDEIDRLYFPEDGANVWVRQRQRLLALSLGDDIPVQPPRGEVIPGEGEKVRTVAIWDAPEGEPVLKLQTMPEHLIPRQRPVYRPSEVSLLRARSYARYLCRKHGVAKVELLRHSRNAVQPANLLRPDMLIPGTFDELVCSFGDYTFEE